MSLSNISQGHSGICKPVGFFRYASGDIIVIVDRTGEVRDQLVGGVPYQLYGVVQEDHQNIVPTRGVDDACITDGVDDAVGRDPAVLVSDAGASGIPPVSKDGSLLFTSRLIMVWHSSWVISPGKAADSAPPPDWAHW